MKIVKRIIKFALIFFVIFILYTFVYNFQASNSGKFSFSSTFLASETGIASTDQASFIPTQTSGLSEANIDKEGFYIRIDKISLFKPIVANVDPRYKDVYQESWETGVSHGKFTALPDQIGNVYLFAHAVSSTSQIESEKAWFSKIDELVENDMIIIYYQNKKYTYQVSKIYSVDPTATGVYTGVSPVPKATLQTCGPPRGSLSSRYMVEALQVSVAEF